MWIPSRSRQEDLRYVGLCFVTSHGIKMQIISGRIGSGFLELFYFRDRDAYPTRILFTAGAKKFFFEGEIFELPN